MKILINGLTLKAGGARTVLVGTLKALARYGPGHGYVVYASTRLDPPMPALPECFEVRRLPRVERSAPAVFLWEQFALPRVIRREGADALYSMCSGHGPRRPGCRQVMLLHSAAWFVSPRERLPCLPRPSAPIRRAVARLGLAGSERVLFQTHAMAERVRRFISVSPDKIVVSPQGVPEPPDAPGFAPRRAELREKLKAFRREHSAVASFLGYYAPYKNIETLLDALEAARGVGLVLGTDLRVNRAARRLARKAASPGLRGRVMVLGAVPGGLTPLAYEASEFFVFPSLLESYGLPMVEAMSRGLPVLAADTPVNREVCGGAALYHAPLDAGELARNMTELAAHAGLRRSLGARARERSKSFGWEEHVRGLLSALGAATSPRRGEPR